VPSRAVRRLSHICLWCLVADTVLYAVKVVLQQFAAQIGPGVTSSQPGTQGDLESLTLTDVLGCYEGLVILIGIAFGILTLILCRRCRTALREAAEQAKENWAEA